jgi:hypothetical protein
LSLRESCRFPAVDVHAPELLAVLVIHRYHPVVMFPAFVPAQLCLLSFFHVSISLKGSGCARTIAIHGLLRKGFVAA